MDYKNCNAKSFCKSLCRLYLTITLRVGGYQITSYYLNGIPGFENTGFLSRILSKDEEKVFYKEASALVSATDSCRPEPTSCHDSCVSLSASSFGVSPRPGCSVNVTVPRDGFGGSRKIISPVTHIGT